MYSEVEGAPAQTDLYDLVYSPSGHYNVGVDNAEVLPWSQLETVDDQPLAQLNLPQLTPVDKKAWWHPSSWGRRPAAPPQPHFYNVEWPQERHQQQPVQQPPPNGAYEAVDPFGALPIMQSQAPPPQQAGAQWNQPFQPRPIRQQQIAPNHADRDESPNNKKRKKTRKMEGGKERSSDSSSLSSSLSSMPASGYVDSISQSSPLDCYVFAPSSSLSAATSTDDGSTGQTPQPTAGPAHYYEPVYMDASPTASGPFAPQVIVQAYGAPVGAAAPAPSPPARVRDWNEEFQRVRMIPQQHRAEPLYLLTKDFVSTATSIGKKIIMEAHTVEWLKTIKPKDAGGVAGGEKYIEEGIFFKFAKDSLGLYGGDEFAAKACNHELRGLNALLNCWVDGLHFPMLCLVDFLGFRLIASSILPITNKTLIYGRHVASAVFGDGGLTVANSSPEFGDKVALVARILNLKAHLVGRSGKPQLLHLAGDVEGHKGTDGRFYILDTARVFPADVPKVSIRCGHLYRLLRPELVKQNPVPLSSDAFSRWGLHRAAQHNGEVVAAAGRLTSEIIPAFIAHLRETLADGSEGHHHRGSGVLFDFWPTNIGTHIDGELLTQQMHRRGINARYLSTIYTALAITSDSAEAAAKLVMTEMVARVVKAMLRTRLRAAEETDSWARARGETVKLFNALFFGDALLPTICTALLTKFELQLDQATVRRGVDREALFLRLQKMAGARFVHDAIDKLRSREDSFAESDIVELEPTVKSMRFVSMYEGFALLRKAEEAVAAPAGQQPDESLDQQRRLYLEAIDKFKECLSAMPDEPNAMMNWGYAFMKLAEMEHRPDVASLLFDAAVAKYEEALGMKYSLNASIYTQAQAMYNMGLCFYHHAGFLRRANAQQQQQQQAPDESSGRRREEEELRLLARAEAQFAELRRTGRMGQVSGNVLFLLACVHALTNNEHQCQECLEGALTAGQLTQALLAHSDFHALRDREWFRLLHQRAPV